jgi:glutaredoxin 3
MVNGGKVTVYTTDPCGFCRQAKALLESRGVDYEEISLTKDPDGRASLVQRTGQMTFPQIIAGDRVIGGFRELLEADRDGTLFEILDASTNGAAAGNGDRSRSRAPLP